MQSIDLSQTQETLCWTCTAPGTGRCVWDESKGITPVEGWTARRTYMRPVDLNAPPIKSYQVLECPLYLPCDTSSRHTVDCNPRQTKRDYTAGNCRSVDRAGTNRPRRT